MQNFLTKLFTFLLIFFLTNGYLFVNQCKANPLQEADSLFEKKEYPKAFEIYSRMLNQERIFSPQMLLKMAFIKESTLDNVEALYYLNLYNRYQHNEKVVEKINSIAKENDLKGYGYSDFEFLITLYNQYYFFVLLAFGTFFFLYFYYLIYLRKIHGNPIYQAIVLLMLMGTFFYLTNSTFEEKFAITRSNPSYLLDSPSAGATLMATIPSGQRIKVIDKTDIWYEVEWQGKICYVREKNLWVIE